MITQAQINEMNGPALTSWYNDNSGKPAIKKFRDLRIGRDEVYSLAHLKGLLDDSAEPKFGGTEEPTFFEQGRNSAQEGIDSAAEEGQTPEEVDAAHEEPVAEDLAAQLKLRPESHKGKVGALLISHLGQMVLIEDLSEAAYGNRAGVGQVKMVLKGIQVAIDKYASKELVLTKGSRGKEFGLFLA